MNAKVLKLKVGIAGYGVVGKLRKECVDRHPNMELVAVCDQKYKEDLDALAKDGILCHQNYEYLLRKCLLMIISNALVMTSGSTTPNIRSYTS